MQPRSPKKRLVLPAVAAAALLAAGVAQAHVTVHPNALPAGAFTVVNVQVPNERDDASTTKVDVQLPAGVYFLSTKPVPGWTAKVVYRKLAKPVKVFGSSLTREVGRVTWTGSGALGRIRPGEFQQFPVSILVPTAKAGTLVSFKSLQTYSNGEVVRWIGDPSAETPAPQVMIRGAGTPVEDYASVSAIRKTASHGAAVALPLGLLGALGLARRARRRS